MVRKVQGMRGRFAVGAALIIASALTACVGSFQGEKLDINYATTQGVGSLTAAAVNLPHARYTFFSYSDPPTCVTSVALIDAHGSPVVDDGVDRAAAQNVPPGAAGTSTTPVGMQMIPTMVQKELASGSYRVKVTAPSRGCAWRVEQILNYMLSNETPLKPINPPVAPPLYISLGTTSPDVSFQIPVAGVYDVQWSVTPCDRYSGDLTRTGGATEHLGDGIAESVPPGTVIAPFLQETPLFLGSGQWMANVRTRCYWHIVVAPWRGSRGGGSQGFR